MRETRHGYFLNKAAELSLRGHGYCEPNPLVGALVVKDGIIIGQGYHPKFGEPHAEIFALLQGGSECQGSTLYTTLEPCSHHGKTPPCCESIFNYGIKEVIIAERDPNSEAAGGIEYLRSKNIKVRLIPNLKSHLILKPYIKNLTKKLPWIVAKIAQKNNGEITNINKENRWISNYRSRLLVHRERGRIDGIMTGMGTILEDDPLLTARNVRVRRYAKRIVIDPNMDLPLNARIINDIKLSSLIIAVSTQVYNIKKEKRKFLESIGITLIPTPTFKDKLDLTFVMSILYDQFKINNIMIEAGSGLLKSLSSFNLIDALWVFTANKKSNTLNNKKDTPLKHLGVKHLWQCVDSRNRNNDLVELWLNCSINKTEKAP